MADLTFDAVVVGGGNKGIVTALYLAAFGGMSVGIFEGRHELAEAGLRMMHLLRVLSATRIARIPTRVISYRCWKTSRTLRKKAAVLWKCRSPGA